MNVDIKELLEGLATEKSKIAGLEVKLNKELYGEKAKQPDGKSVIVKTENGADVRIGVPRGMDCDGASWKVTEKLAAAKSVRDKRSIFGGFIKKYKEYPAVGIEVETVLDAKGYKKIVV